MAKIAIVDLSDDSARKDAFGAALAMYTGERCKYCGFLYATITDLRDREVVFAGYHEHGRTACKDCWDKHNHNYPD